MVKKKKEIKKQKRLVKHREKTLVELQRKPSLRREYKRAFAFVATIVIAFDFIITGMLGASYIEHAEEMVYTQAQDYSRRINNVNIRYDSYDFSDYKGREKMLAENDQWEKEKGTSLYQILVGLDYATDTAWITGDMYGYLGKTIGDVSKIVEDYITGSDYNLHYNTYYALYNKNGDLITKSSPNLYLFYSDKTKEQDDKTRSTRYILDVDSICKYCPEAMTLLVENGDVSFFNYIKYTPEDIYTNGYYYLPKKIKITTVKDSFDDYEEVVLEEVDLSACDFTGYTKITVDDQHKILGPILIGDLFAEKENSVTYAEKYYNSLGEEYFAKRIPEYYHEYLEDEDTEKWDDGWEYGFFSLKANNFVENDNESLVCVIAVDYNFFRDFRLFLILFYTISFIIVAITSLILAKKRLVKKQLLYEMDSYRRRTTNAMAHDLKSPLMIISGNAENLRQIDKSEQVKRYTDDILDAVKDMDQMIANILDLAKLEDVSLKLDLAETSLAELFGKEITKKQTAMDEKGITCHLDGNVKLRCDMHQITRLIDNLLGNAIKYGAKDSVIEIQLNDTHFTMDNRFDGEIQVDAKELLEPFVKGSQMRTNTTGNGLGLSIANQIAMAHGYILKIQTDENHFIVEIKF